MAASYLTTLLPRNLIAGPAAGRAGPPHLLQPRLPSLFEHVPGYGSITAFGGEPWAEAANVDDGAAPPTPPPVPEAPAPALTVSRPQRAAVSPEMASLIPSPRDLPLHEVQRAAEVKPGIHRASSVLPAVPIEPVKSTPEPSSFAPPVSDPGRSASPASQPAGTLHPLAAEPHKASGLLLPNPVASLALRSVAPLPASATTPPPHVVPRAGREPEIHVTIGRVEVRAVSPLAPTQKPRPQAATSGLDEYLRRRGGSR